MTNPKNWKDILELPKVIELIAEYCEIPAGRQFTVRLMPEHNESLLRRRQNEASEISGINAKENLPSLEGINIPQNALRLARAGSMLDASSLRRIFRAIVASENVSSFYIRRLDKAPCISQLCSGLPQLSDVRDAIDAVLDDRERVRDTASRDISRLRRTIVELEDRISAKMRGMARSPEFRKMLQFPEPTFSGERFVLAVKTEHRSKFPGLLHYSSDSGATSFMEPMSVIENTNELQLCRSAESAEERKLLTQLSITVGRNANEIEELENLMASIDFYGAVARFAVEYNCTFPFLTRDNILTLKDARHPLLMLKANKLKKKDPDNIMEVVPLTMTLGADFNLLVVTGPNTGGKTVAIKTIGILSLMALCGLPIPAAEADIPIYDNVFSDIGDEQSIEQNLSTFSSHMSRIINLLTVATSRSLVLLDELGSGTDPAEGAALGRAILEHLLEKKVSAVVTTHIGSLKRLAFEERQVQNASMEFDIETLRPTFHLTVGSAGESKALQIAARLGMPTSIVQRGSGLVERTSDGEQANWMELQRIRRELEEERETAKAKGREAAQLRREADKLREEWREKMDSLEKKAEEKAKVFNAGDKVYVRLARENGTVVRINRKGQATVNIKGRNITLPVTDLEPPR